MFRKTVMVVALGAMVSGCGAVGRLKAVGKAPALTPIEPVAAPAFEPSLASPADPANRRAGQPGMPATDGAGQSASLFRTGAGSFFRDQRARRVGDVLTIRINISDKADLGNNTSRTRGGSENTGVASLLGLEKVLPKSIDPANLASTNSSSSYAGGGSTRRSETISMTMAAIVTQVLPNGNLVVRGRQEVRVNFEMRELIVTGIVRPEDIGRDNSIRHSQIAEARIIYGGKGQLTDAQQARWGQQIYDALFPF